MPSFRLIGLSILVAFSTSVFAARVEPTGKSVPNEVLVKVRSAASTNDVSALEKLADADKSQKLAKVGSGTLMRLRSRSKNTEALTKALENNPHVEFVEPNYILELMAEPNDPSYAQLWGLENTGQNISGSIGTAGADIDAEAAWNVTTGSNAVVVGVVDTGVDYTHPDLAANMWTNPGGKGNAACGAGTFGFNAITNTCNPQDDHGHGTHVAGTIGAVGNNGVGVAGVNWTASMMALKFLDAGGSGTTADAVTAIDFAVQAKIDGVNVRVLSNSWGGGGFSKALLDVINKANENDILFVAAAGNNGSNNDTYTFYPANYTTPNMISVAATDNRDSLAWFSNWGATTVHLAAPGVSTYSTLWGGSYGYKSGTSMATPHVAGVAALVLAAFPSYTTAQVKSAILDGTDPLPNLTGLCISGGRLNAAKAVGGTPSPDFSIAVNPGTRTVTQGGATSYSLTINAQNGFGGSVALEVSGLPTGATASITPATTTTTATLAVSTSSNTPLSPTTLTITGTSGAMTRTAYAGLSVVASPTLGACPSFSVAYGPYLSAPSAVAIGDLNGDGKSDYAVADASLNAVVIRYGRFFSTGTTLAVGKAPLFVTTGDLNGDGKLDLATANSLSHDVSVLLANGSGGFNPAVHYSAGTSPFAVTTGDFNRDGKLDLAVANNGSSNVSILLGQSGGTFAAATHFTAGSSPFWVTAADVDADGSTDLAVANFNGGNVSLLRGNGDGTFNAPLNTTAGTKPSSVAAADFNGDGKTDLAVSNYGSNDVSLLTGNGDGTFDAAVNFAVGTKPYSVAAGDLDGDGKLDLVTGNSTSNTVSILLASGFGSFNTAVHVSVGYAPSQARIGDYNDDGKPDILVAAQNSQTVVYVTNVSSCALNCGTLASAVDSAVAATPDSAAVGDFNGDGKLDLAVVDNASNNVVIRLGNGDGTFTAGAVVAAGTDPRGIVAADFNRDGKLDLAVASLGSNEVAILIGNGDGTWQNAVAYAAGTAPRSVAVGDFNRDGKLDLAVPARDDNAVAILLGGGDGTFQAPVSYSTGTSPRAVAVGDFNRDGVADLAVANASSANVSVLLGNANGTFQSAVNFNVGTTPRSVIAGDFNADGKTDLAVANAGSNNVSFLAGNGNGGFSAAVNHATGTVPHALIAVDLNLDGFVDLLTANNTSHDVSVLLATDSGVWGPATSTATGLNPTALVGGDFNRDGKTDLVTINGGAGSFSLLLNTCPVPDLTVTKTHSGTFTQGGTGNYTITASNSGLTATSGVVTVKDTLPQGLAATAMTGTGWTCVAANATCTRSDSLAAGASYPPITMTVRVYGNAPLNVTNTVTVSGGGEVSSSNNTASDPTTITAATDLLLIKTHSGAFAQGASGRKYSLVVRNSGGLATSGTVTVTDTLPSGLIATALSGTGWSCNLGSLTCTRSDALAGGSNYPAIALTVNVAANAPSLITNTATVTGGGDASPFNNTASDPTVVWSTNTCGTFGGATYYSMNGQAIGLAVADFNNDGRSDVATGGGYYSNSVSVRLGAGDGTLLSAVNYTAPYPAGLSTGDLDHDGDLDLVAASNESDAKVSVLLGNGDGTFAPVVSYDVLSASYLYDTQIADFDRDGNLDVITVDTYYADTAYIFLGNGDGTLRAPAAVALSANIYAWTVSDMDGDAIVDLIVATSGYSLQVLRGNGDATFQTAVTSPLSGSVNSLTTGDFNGDGKQDIAGSAYSDAVILLGNGNGTFGTGVYYDTEYSNYYVTTADINADGKLDVITGGYYISTLLGNGNGTFQSANTYYSDSSRVAVTDFNGDGKADLASSGWGGVRIYLGGCPDLAISKKHSGNFYGGSNGVYTIKVTNAGGGAATGEVTVTDTLPNGLTLNSYDAYAWTCTVAGQTLTCTRTGTLIADPTNYWWEISLNVKVSPSAPTSVTNVATLTVAGDTNPANNTASDPTTIVHAPDLVISKTHNGTWAPGQTGTYTITVGNVGTANTSGTVTVTDSLPYGLSPVSMGGTGWTCNSLTCTRSDALAPTAVYPPITLTVTVLSGAGSAYNYASVSGGGETNLYNNSVSDYTRIITPPTLVVATTSGASQVTVTWSVPWGEQPVYEVFRSSGNGSYAQVGSTLGNTFYDNSAAPNMVYLYKVRKVEGSVIGPFSSPDFASTFGYTDDPVVARTTRIKRVHVEQLRNAVNLARNAAGLTAKTFTDASLVGLRIKKIHITELRTALNEARTQVGINTVTFSDSTSIKAAHINDLRNALK